MKSQQVIRVNFFVSGTYSLTTPGGQTIKISQETNYPADGNVRIIPEIQQPEEMVMQIRKPAWCREIRITVNGLLMDSEADNGLISLRRIWNPGDVILLNLNMPAEIHQIEGRPSYYAITKGPVVLARDIRLPGLNPDAILVPVLNNGRLLLTPVESHDPGIWMQFTGEFLPESYAEEGPRPVSVILCDYASAGNTYDERSRFRTWFSQIIDPSSFK